MKYKHIFFDLDHTLWDYERNSEECLKELYKEYALEKYNSFTFSRFFNEFRKVNLSLWDRYNAGTIDRGYIRENRFKKVFENLGVESDGLEPQFSDKYLRLCPAKKNLLPHAREVLNYLAKDYELSIITNGFSDIQDTKLQKSGIEHYFSTVTTSECTGFRKPSKEIFEWAVKVSGSKKSEAIMIGDSLKADVLGAIRSSIDAIYYNPEKSAHNEDITYEVTCLSQIMNIL